MEENNEHNAYFNSHVYKEQQMEKLADCWFLTPHQPSRLFWIQTGEEDNVYCNVHTDKQ